MGSLGKKLHPYTKQSVLFHYNNLLLTICLQFEFDFFFI